MRTLTAAAAALALACAQACDPDAGDAPARYDPSTFTAADEEAIAKALERERYRDESVVVIAPEADRFTDGAYDYLRPVLRELVDQPAVTRRDSFAWDLWLVLDDDPHAYTLPGGRIVLHTGLLHALADEAELAGVLAREIALAEIGAAMAALDREVDDNVTLGDMIVGTPVPLDALVARLPHLAYDPADVARADSLAALLLCPGDREELAVGTALGRVGDLGPGSRYEAARPLPDGTSRGAWAAAWGARVSACGGPDSLYAARYRAAVGAYVP